MQELPFTTGPDEPIYVERALTMIAKKDANPAWFGNPGSTTFYPLALLFGVWHEISDHSLFSSGEFTQGLDLTNDVWEYYFVGRLLSVFYLVATLPLLYVTGARIFDKRVGLIGALLFATYSTVIFHAKIVRTDTAATFFGMLSIWFFFAVLQQPSRRNQIMAGVSIGLAIASRYFMVMLIPFYIAIQFFSIQRANNVERKPYLWPSILAGLLAIPLSFLVVTPFFIFDFETVQRNIIFEVRSVHPGYDGLTPAGNFFWYLTSAIPHMVGWVQLIFVIVGLLAILNRRRVESLLLVVYIVVFLGAISMSPLHWHRWAIPILPLIALISAFGIITLTDLGFGIVNHASSRVKTTVYVFTVLLAVAWPLSRTILLDIRQATKSTGIEAREWILANLPTDAYIVEEAYTAPLNNTDYAVEWYFSLVEHDLDEYIAQDMDYAIVSSNIYNRFLSDPEQYPDEVAFYERLFTDAELLQSFEPNYTQSGSTILIFRIDEPRQ